MYARNGQVVPLLAHFTLGGVAATGLTVTGKVWEGRSNGTKVPNDTTGTTLTVVELGKGLYFAVYTMTGDGVPVAVFSTASAVDQKDVPAIALNLTNLDAAVTSRATQMSVDANATAIAANAASLATILSQLAVIAGYTDSVESGIAGLQTTTNLVAGYTDSVEGTLSALESSLSGVADAIATVQATADTVQSVVEQIDENMPDYSDVVAVQEAVATMSDALTSLRAVVDAISSQTTALGGDNSAIVEQLTTLQTGVNVVLSQTDSVETSLATIQTLVRAIPTTQPDVPTVEEIASAISIPPFPNVPTKDEVAVAVDDRLTGTHPGNWSATSADPIAGDGAFPWTPTVTKEGAAVAGAYVKVEDGDGNVVGTVLTNREGKCMADGIPAFRLDPGAYLAIITYNGLVNPFEFIIDANGNEVR